MGLLAKYPQIEQFLLQYIDAPRWLLGVSGGADSIALMAIVRAICDRHDAPPVTVVYINHGLHPDAEQWGHLVQGVSQRLLFGFDSKLVSVIESGRGLEDAARAARYSAFETLMCEQDVLMTAHHLDDQLETFLMRAFRGAGPEGLRAMLPERRLGRGRLVRPCLGIPKTELLSIAEQVAPEFVRDPTNHDSRYDRGFLRQELIPLIQSRWPQAALAVGRSTELMQAFWQRYGQTQIPHVWATTGEPILSIPSELEGDAVAAMIRAWLAELNLLRPPKAQLDEFVRQLRAAREDQAPVLQTAQYQLKWYAGAIHCCADQERRVVEMCSNRTATGVRLDSELGCFRLMGVPAELLAGFEFRPLLAGESCRTHAKRPRRKLTKLLHEWRIPPWWRGEVAVLCYQAEVVGVLNRIIDRDLLVQIDPRLADMKIDWQHQLIEKSPFVYRQLSQ